MRVRIGMPLDEAPYEDRFRLKTGIRATTRNVPSTSHRVNGSSSSQMPREIVAILMQACAEVAAGANAAARK